MGLPIDDQFDRLLRPWARFAQQAGRLAGWLASSHLTRAIDEYSVMETERVLETSGFMPPRTTAQPAVAFVDLTGFTRLTEERGDEAAAAVALRLGELATEVVEVSGGRIVKLLGDGVLLRFADPATAIDGALALLDALPASGLPTGHAGVAAGPLIVRDNDVFGRTVNLASRIADVTPDGRLFTTAESAASIPDRVPRRFRLQPIEASVLPGIGRVELVEVLRDQIA
jgi:class 3 adenylate cyclase